MNYIWGMLIVFSVISAAFLGRGEQLLNAAVGSAESAIYFCITIGSAIILWSGIMNIAKRAGLCDMLAKLLDRPLQYLFGNISDPAKQAITMNISCNFLGLGNAATPFGIQAMKLMRKGETGTNPMIMFVVITTASVQLLPISVAAIRKAAGAPNPFDIIFCVWATSICSQAAGIIMCKLFEFMGRKKHGCGD